MLAYTRTTLDAARANLHIMLSLVEQGKIKCSAKTQRPSAATVKLIRASLDGGDFYSHEDIQSFAWPLILQAGGLAAGPTLKLTAKGKRAQSRQADQVLIELWNDWQLKGPLDEIMRVEAIKGKTGKNVLSALRPRRIAAAESIELLPIDSFMDLDELFGLVYATGDFTCARYERSTWRFYMEHPEYGSFGYDGRDFAGLVDKRYLMVLLFEYAATLGLVDVRYIQPENARDDLESMDLGDVPERVSRYDGLMQLRLTRIGV